MDDRRLSDANQVRARLGFRDGDSGTHSSRTMMLRELEILLDSTSADAVVADYRRAIQAQKC